MPRVSRTRYEFFTQLMKRAPDPRFIIVSHDADGCPAQTPSRITKSSPQITPE
jgi:hypothetical protein